MLRKHERTETNRSGKRREGNRAHGGRELIGSFAPTVQNVNRTVDAKADEHGDGEEVCKVELNANERHETEEHGDASEDCCGGEQ